jgi:3-polyprenyl-4-hydroxybenzoate decarboxylase
VANREGTGSVPLTIGEIASGDNVVVGARDDVVRRTADVCLKRGRRRRRITLRCRGTRRS